MKIREIIAEYVPVCCQGLMQHAELGEITFEIAEDLKITGIKLKNGRGIIIKITGRDFWERLESTFNSG